MAMTLADLQTQEAAAPVVETPAEVIPANLVFDVDLVHLGNEKRRTKYQSAFGQVRTIAWLPGSTPEMLKGETLVLPISEATGSKTKDGRTTITWEKAIQGEGKTLLVNGYVPEDATHIESVALQFPEGN